MPSVDKACETCAKPMRVSASRLTAGKGRFCSMGCRKNSVEYVSRTCEWCSTTFTARKDRCDAGNAKYCSRSCTSKSTWAKRPAGRAYKAVFIPGHPLAVDERGRVAEHKQVLYDAIGPGPHPCHWCGRQVGWKSGRAADGALIADHLNGNNRDNRRENLVPACHGCNITRSRTDLVEDGELYVTMTGNPGRHRAVERTCETCGEKFPHIAADKRPNRGRYCSKACMYARRH